MSCPVCEDFLTYSEYYVFENLSPEISILAERFAKSEALKHLDMYVDFYMLYYRREYERLLELKKHTCLDAYKASLLGRYNNHPRLCKSCNHGCLQFDHSAKFCFHNSDFDPSCENCFA